MMFEITPCSNFSYTLLRSKLHPAPISATPCCGQNCTLLYFRLHLGVRWNAALPVAIRRLWAAGLAAIPIGGCKGTKYRRIIVRLTNNFCVLC